MRTLLLCGCLLLWSGCSTPEVPGDLEADVLATSSTDGTRDIPGPPTPVETVGGGETFTTVVTTVDNRAPSRPGNDSTPPPPVIPPPSGPTDLPVPPGGAGDDAPPEDTDADTCGDPPLCPADGQNEYVAPWEGMWTGWHAQIWIEQELQVLESSDPNLDLDVFRLSWGPADTPQFVVLREVSRFDATDPNEGAVVTLLSVAVPPNLVHRFTRHVQTPVAPLVLGRAHGSQIDYEVQTEYERGVNRDTWRFDFEGEERPLRSSEDQRFAHFWGTQTRDFEQFDENTASVCYRTTETYESFWPDGRLRFRLCSALTATGEMIRSAP